MDLIQYSWSVKICCVNPIREISETLHNLLAQFVTFVKIAQVLLLTCFFKVTRCSNIPVAKSIPSIYSQIDGSKQVYYIKMTVSPSWAVSCWCRYFSILKANTSSSLVSTRFVSELSIHLALMSLNYQCENIKKN